jgi:small subunit ribosomal protein S16
MLSIRLSRTGKRKQPLYRLIVTEKSKDPWGTFLENLGTYNPRSTPVAINFKADRIKDWISKGAQCSDTVWNMLVEQKIVTGDMRKKVRITKKRREKMEKAKATA